MVMSANQFTARTAGGVRYEPEPFEPFERPPHYVPAEAPARSIQMYERIIGHALLSQEIQAEEAVLLLGQYEAWFATSL